MPVPMPSPPMSVDDLPTTAVMAAESAAIAELCGMLATRDIPERSIYAWAAARGWESSDVMRWLDRIQASMAEREGADLGQIKRRLTARLERVAHSAESSREFGDAVKATEVEARLHGLLSDGKSAPAVAIQINSTNLNADQIRALSDNDLRQRLAQIERRATLAEPASMAAPPESPAISPRSVNDLL